MSLLKKYSDTSGENGYWDPGNLPSTELLQKEVARLKKRSGRPKALLTILAVLVILSMILALVVCFLCPIKQMYGNAMSPEIEDGEIVLLTKRSEYKPGDIVCCIINGRECIRRVAATGGDVVDMDESGNLLVNGSVRAESCIKGSSFPVDLKMPLKLGEKAVAVYTDNTDSGSREVELIGGGGVIGKVFAPFSIIHKVG